MEGMGGMGGRAAELQEFLSRHIPMTRAMAVEVIEAGDEGVRIRAPLGANQNHHGTLFGGSASALAILAAWGWMYLELESEGLDPDLVIQRSAMEFVEPGRGDVEIVCQGVPAAEWKRFLRMFRRFGRGRLTLHSEIHSRGCVVARMAGDFVALDPERHSAD